MIGAILTAALLAALAVSGYRLWRRLRRRRLLASLPGGSRATAVEVEAFSEIDDHLYARECPCGGALASMGERSERVAGEEGERLLRVVRVECRRCEDRLEVWFDVTRAYN